MPLIPLFVLAQSASNQGSQGGPFTIFLLIFLAYFVVRRISRGLSGRRFSYRRIIYSPVLLILLSVLFLFYPQFYLVDVYVLLGFMAVGILVSSRLRHLSSVFTMNGNVMYRSSPVFVGIWAFSYIGRLSIEFIFGISSFLIDAIFLALLSLSAGMYLGEGVNILNKYAEFKKGNGGTGTDSVVTPATMEISQDDFR
ncbi:MAG: hypothetical protein M1533_01145 [Candidatus Thermoplasmatota archaeon]|nr:hypothetical protein [Candidatus Thermoplasmatota archaeon]MCL5794630.1 hypothetical protein [Candidatus Thermoplasmatota archaeon]